MSKVSLAARLSDELGVSMAKAQRFVDDVGADLADDLAGAADETSRVGGDWWKPAAAATGLAGGGALAWRQQEIDKQRANNADDQTSKAALEMLLNDDSLSPETKRELAKSLYADIGDGSDGSGGGGSGSGDGGLIPDDPQTLIVLVIVLVFVLKFTLEGDE